MTTVLYHDDFDGLASAAMLVPALQAEGFPATDLIPVNHDSKAAWRNTFLRDSFGVGAAGHIAILDFNYHPDADWWFDHHPSTFQSGEDYEADFRRFREAPRPGRLPHYRLDIGAASCAGLVHQALAPHVAGVSRLVRLATLANRVDAALYLDPQEVYMPADWDVGTQVANAWRLLTPGEKRQLIERLARFPDPVHAVLFLERKLQAAQEGIRAALGGYDRLVAMVGAVARVNLLGSDTPFLRYAPYLLQPEAEYAVSLYEDRSRGTVRLSVNKNPWLAYGPVDLGAVMESVGVSGGGHTYAAGTSFPADEYLRATAELFSVARQVDHLNAASRKEAA